uniref:Uncharacterized protein n=1 Tax=Alexandrium monilatum TaxID=311494 RepID=A0A7S4RJR3_9DINO|eukprot:CAMPEP_0175220186 /NCGR_PEP_ID=MMETSP0093-20121207/19655_1 /TAXON_ID=311494 /ORGANISM="Alexandrium monilatum, Strain CCMP3105" /LENGTH=373 /DNA_ID=CAMNT_0016513687 /DNA_START=35 /DNA_END=1156 /DNA_ORIENTATION=-
MPVPWAALAGAAGVSVATVAACTAVGVYARRAGVLTASALKDLDKLVSSIYLPCLIFKKVLPNTNAGVLLDVWPLGVVCCASVLYGLLAGALVGRGTPRFRGMVMVAIAFPNSFSVPLTLMLALGDLPVLLTQGQPGGDALAARVNFLFLMSYSLWTLARWSIGFPLLSGAISFREWRRKVLNPPVVACLLAAGLGLAWDQVPVGARPRWEERLRPLLQPLSAALQYAGQCSVPSILLTLGAKVDEAVASLWGRSKRTVSGSRAKLLAAAELPVEETLPASSYVAVLVMRQVLGPALGALLSLGVLRGLCGVTDPVVLLVGMLQTAGPPMINLAIMSGLSGTAEKETARLLLLTYGCSAATWTLSIAFFLALL